MKIGAGTRTMFAGPHPLVVVGFLFFFIFIKIRELVARIFLLSCSEISPAMSGGILEAVTVILFTAI